MAITRKEYITNRTQEYIEINVHSILFDKEPDKFGMKYAYKLKDTVKQWFKVNNISASYSWITNCGPYIINFNKEEHKLLFLMAFSVEIKIANNKRSHIRHWLRN